MKSFRTWWSVLPASALVLGACNEKKQEEAASTPAAAPATVVEKAKELVAAPAVPEVKALTPGERAAMLGIVGHLSKDVESVLGIYDGAEIVKRARALKTWEFIREIAKEEGETDPEAEIGDQLGEAGKFLGQEMFIAAGKGTGLQLENVIAIQHRYQYYTFRLLAQAFAEGAKNGALDAAGGMTPELIQGLTKDLTKELDLVSKLAVPPVLVGIKAADADSLKMAQGQLEPGIANIAAEIGEEGAKTVEFTKGRVTFKGVKLLGSYLAAQMEQGREQIEQTIAPADLDKLLASLKEKNLVIAHGALDNYLMVYAGGSEDACPLVDKVDDSLAASDAISYVDGFKDKKVVGFLHADKAIGQASVYTSLKDMALGVRDGLAGSTAFGDTRDLATLLEMVGDKEAELLGLTKVEAGGGVAVLDGGFKLEFFGGNNQNAFDLTTAHKLGKLGAGESTLLFANWVGNPEYTKRANALGEVLIQTGYEIAEKVAALEVDSPQLTEFKGAFSMFNDKFRADTVGIWESLQLAEAGLGDESALVVDLKGTVPPVPSVPQEFVDGGKFLRASLITPVTDRTKLDASWTKLDGSLKNIFKNVSELAGEDIPMQRPMSSKEDGLTTWSFSFPFFNDDFLPSITVSDKWFVASTSKVHALELAKAADSAAAERSGAWFEMDFDALRTFSAEWVTLLEKDGEAVMGADFEEFKAQVPRIKKGLAAFEEFDSLNIHERIEGGKHRTTLHFKVR